MLWDLSKIRMIGTVCGIYAEFLGVAFATRVYLNCDLSVQLIELVKKKIGFPVNISFRFIRDLRDMKFVPLQFFFYIGLGMFLM